MKAKIENRDGVDYLSFTPQGMRFPTTIPVITTGSRDEAGAWTWNCSLNAPTVRPSVRTQYANEKGENVIIHYWLNNGVCQCLNDCTDGNANKNINLIDYQEQKLKNEKMKKQNFTRAEVVKIINELLIRPDVIIDAVTNEVTEHDAESLLQLVEVN